jgi:hypothetical protein
MTIVLCAVIIVATATYTWVTWKAVAATREASEIQKQLLELQKARPASKAASARRQDPRATARANTESQRAKDRARPGAREPDAFRREATDRQAAPVSESDGAAPARGWTTRSAMAERFGRQ